MADIDRFLDAQDRLTGGYATALAEMRAGRKRSHWIWYIFPQVLGLGSSPMAQLYGIRDLEEARRYASHPILGRRLGEILQAATAHLEQGRPLDSLMGGEIDARKFVSSLTLFAIAAPADGDLEEQCRRALDLADAQGFAECVFTRQAAEER